MQDNFYAMKGTEAQTANPHALSSNVRQNGTGISVFHLKKRSKPDLNRYLQGRSYQLFKRGVKASRTLEDYNRRLKDFVVYSHHPKLTPCSNPAPEVNSLQRNRKTP